MAIRNPKKIMRKLTSRSLRKLWGGSAREKDIPYRKRGGGYNRLPAEDKKTVESLYVYDRLHSKLFRNDFRRWIGTELPDRKIGNVLRRTKKSDKILILWFFTEEKVKNGQSLATSKSPTRKEIAKKIRIRPEEFDQKTEEAFRRFCKKLGVICPFDRKKE